MKPSPPSELTAAAQKLSNNLERWQTQLSEGPRARTHMIGMVTKALNSFEVILRDLLGWYVDAFELGDEPDLIEAYKRKALARLTLGEVIQCFDLLNDRLTRRLRTDDGALRGRKLLTPAELRKLRHISATRRRLHSSQMEADFVAGAADLFSALDSMLLAPFLRRPKRHR